MLSPYAPRAHMIVSAKAKGIAVFCGTGDAENFFLSAIAAKTGIWYRRMMPRPLTTAVKTLPPKSFMTLRVSRAIIMGLMKTP